MTSLWSRTAKGQKTCGTVLRKRGSSTTLVASMRLLARGQAVDLAGHIMMTP